ncbi:hypothetical protein E4U55_001687 [Claviceps digitariae]|nr:hypothetical protein E4U55_001687 [Claviceps digitariae]
MRGPEAAASSGDAIQMLTPAKVMAPSAHYQSSLCHALGSVLDSAFGSSWPSAISSAWSADSASGSASTSASTSTSTSSSLSTSASACADAGPPIMTSFAEVILQCNKFQQDVSSLYEFWILDHDSPVGYMLPRFVNQMIWTTTGFEINDTKRTVHLKPKLATGESVFSACEREFIRLCRLNTTRVDGLKKWVKTWDLEADAEHHPIRGLGVHLTGLKVPSPLRGVFGIVTAGAHLNMYTMVGVGDNARMHIWMAKRSDKVTYAGKLDQLVAGAMSSRDDNKAIEVLRREAMEEAGLAVDVETGQVSRRGEYVGTVQRGPRISFYDKKDGVAGSEVGQLEPGIRFTFDLQVEAGFVPEPCEPDCIAGFMLKSVDEVKRDLKNREWKPNCALVMLDFLLRKGQMLPEEEEDGLFRHLGPALQRPLPFRRI